MAVLFAMCITAVACPTARADGPLDMHTSPNLEWMTNVPIGSLTEGGRLIGDSLFVTDDFRGLVIFDVSQPDAPVLSGELYLPHLGENEDIATNGSIALISQGWLAGAFNDVPVSSLHVIDVSDTSHPNEIATLRGAGDHTYECLDGCAWAYGGFAGNIVDLRDPARPVIAGNWRTAIGLPRAALTHDTTEIAPGRVLVAGDGLIYLLDTTDPVHPVVIARSEPVRNAYLHTVETAGDFVFSSTESVGPTPHCSVNDEVAFNHFRTWDAASLRLIDEYGPSNGMFEDGDPPVSVRGTEYLNNGCSSHWFDMHPDFADSGIVALGAYSHGMKLLHVDDAGRIEEVGHFLPPMGADVSAAYWITQDILYVVSYERGIDVLRLRGAP
jgi:hypothetical protein